MVVSEQEVSLLEKIDALLGGMGQLQDSQGDEAGRDASEGEEAGRDAFEGEEADTSVELAAASSQPSLVQTTTEAETIDRDLLDNLLNKARRLVSNGRESLPDHVRVKDLIRLLAREKTLLSVLLYLSTNISSTGVEVENLLMLAIQSRSVWLVAFLIAAGFRVDVAGKVKSAVGDGGLNGVLSVSNAKELCTKLSTAAVLEKKIVQKALNEITQLIVCSDSDRVSTAITILKDNKLPCVLHVEPIKYNYTFDTSDAEKRKLAKLAKRKEKEDEQKKKATKKEKEAAERKALRLREGKSALSKAPTNWCRDILDFTDYRLKGDAELERLAQEAGSIFSNAKDFAFAIPAIIEEIRSRAEGKAFNESECNRSLGDIGEKAFGSVEYASALLRLNRDGMGDDEEEEAEERQTSALDAAAAAIENATDMTVHQPEDDDTTSGDGNNDDSNVHPVREIPEGSVALTLYAPDRQRFAADSTITRRATIFESSDHSFQQASLNHDQAAVFGPFCDEVFVTVHPLRSNVQAHFENKSELVLPAIIPRGNLFTIFGLKGQKTTVVVASKGPELKEIEEAGGDPLEEQGNEEESQRDKEDEEEKEETRSNDSISANDGDGDDETLANKEEGSLSSSPAANNTDEDVAMEEKPEKHINNENGDDVVGGVGRKRKAEGRAKGGKRARH